MVVDSNAKLIAALEDAAGDDKRIACEDAFEVARTVGVAVADVGRVCNELGIKVTQCRLGCF